MEICYDQTQLERFVAEAFIVAQGQPVLIDRFLEDAIEVDVDAISDGQTVVVAGIMEHIEEAGVHSGDSACCIPPYSLQGPILAEIRAATHALARRMNVVGLMNVQYAIKKEDGAQTLYVLEVNPRASRTVPFVSKATGLAVAKIAAKVMAGMTLDELGCTSEPIPSHVSIKESVGRNRAAARGDDLHQRRAAGQGAGRRAGPPAFQAGLQADGHGRDGAAD
jgi:carbamoyl-phosphate synthase large subunit